MKRNMDLLRNLLIQVESTDFDPQFNNPWVMFSSKGVSFDYINYHARLILEKGFFYSNSVKLDGQTESGQRIAKFLPDALTNEGHEFLETIRDPQVWQKTKDKAEKVNSFGIDLIKDFAKGYIKVKAKKLADLDLSD